MLRVKQLSEDERVVEIRNCLDMGVQHDLDPYFEQLAMDDSQVVTLRLTSLKSINAITIIKIVMLSELLGRSGKRLQVRGCRDEVFNTLSYLGINKLIPIEK